MTNMRRVRDILFAVFALCFLLVAYTNCGGFGAAGNGLTLNSNGQSDDSLRLFCEQDLKAKFNTSYRPLFNESGLCVACHADFGASPFKFSSSDLNTAFASFMSVGADRVDANAVSTTHAGGITGPNLASKIETARASWDPAYAKYETCLNGGTGGGGPQTPAALSLDAKNIPELYFGDGKTVSVSWLLSNEVIPVSARFPAVFTIDIRVVYETSGDAKVPTGYAFAKPRIQMLTGESEVEIEGVIVRVNDAQAEGIEEFLSAKKSARGVDYATIYSGEVKSPLPVISSSDKISIAFGYFKLQARTDNPPIPAAATLAIPNPFTRTVSVPVQVTNDSTARRWCLTTSSAKPSSTAAACPGFEGATTTGWLAARPTTFDLASIGRAPETGETFTLYLWVANSDLKISASPGAAQVTFDTTLPAAPALGGVILGDTQIATLTGLGDSNETVSWCVQEGATQASVERADGCSFGTVKPTFVGLRGSGMRYVAVYVRDRAGNQSRSDIRTVSNPYGRISYEQLTTASFGARAVIANNCFSCHGAGGAQQTKFDASTYASTIAKKAGILNRIDNAAQPMPATGLMGEKERALIRLWFTQTSTPVQQ